jgi:hypothetical protein
MSVMMTASERRIVLRKFIGYASLSFIWKTRAYQTALNRYRRERAAKVFIAPEDFPATEVFAPATDERC